MNPTINEFESIIVEDNNCIKISIKNITKIMKIIISEFPGLLSLFQNLDNTVETICNTYDYQNKFSKIELGSDNKTLLGVNFIGKTLIKNKNCIISKCISYKTIFHFTIFSVVITDHNQIEELHNYFNSRFDDFTHHIDVKFKEYIEFNKCNNSYKNKILYNRANDLIHTFKDFEYSNNNKLVDVYTDSYYEFDLYEPPRFFTSNLDIKKRLNLLKNKINRNENLNLELSNPLNLDIKSHETKKLKHIFDNLKDYSYKYT